MISEGRLDRFFCRALWIVLAVLVSLRGISAHAERDSYVRDTTPRKENLFSERVDTVDTRNGNLIIRHIDVSIPGNGGLDIEVVRTYDMLGQSTGLTSTHSYSYKWTSLGPGWTIFAAPRLINSNFWQFHVVNDLVDGSKIYARSEFVSLCLGDELRVGGSGISLVLPDGNTNEIYSTAPGIGKTKNNWKVGCVSGLVYAISPNGVKYDFGDYRYDGRVGVHMNYEPADYIDYDIDAPSFNYMDALKATDASGNTLTFTHRDHTYLPRRYNSDWAGGAPLAGPLYMQKGYPYWVDGREESLYARQISNIVSSDGRSVSFKYHPTTGRLETVVAGDGRQWTYSYTSRDANNTSTLSTVTLPNSDVWRYEYAPGAFHVGQGNHGNIRYETVTARKLIGLIYPTGGKVTYEYGSYDRFSNCCGVVGERIAKRSMSTGEIWSYVYKFGRGPSESIKYDETSVTGPDGTTTYKYMGTGYAYGSSRKPPQNFQNNIWQVGQLMEAIYPDGSTEKYVWQTRELMSRWNWMSLGEYLAIADERVWAADLQKRTIVRDGATYTTTYSNYDAYGNPRTIVETGPNGGSRTTTLTYYNEVSKWIIGKPLTESSPGNSVVRTYDAKGNLTSYSRNGVKTSYTYDTQGNVATKTFPRGLVHTYSNYYRGIPQEENQPESVNIYREVDGAGNVTSETNGNGHTVHYSYDGLNRLTSISPPIGDATAISYGTNHKESVRGNLVERTNYDAFGRPANVTLGGIKTSFSYDAFGRRIFESNPGSTQGTNYEYDVHNRITKITNADASTQQLTYTAGKTAIKDERGNTTTYTYRSYGNPSEQYLTNITAPETSANITIARNPDNLISSVTQNGVTRSYTYNTNGYLATAVHPEIGTITYGRDIAGNMTSRANALATVYYTYDDRNRLEHMDYGSRRTSFTYNAQDKILSTTAYGSTRAYSYDQNGNLIREELDYDGNIVHFALYEYNSKDQLKTVQYPSSAERVDYAPDALGRPTKVASNLNAYVSSVTYWPSGQLKEITYANGTVTKYGQNSRLWPSTFSTQKSSTYYHNSAYVYDGVGNLTSITDSTDNSYSRSLGYDKINRLTTANGPWGAGSITYDGRGNITKQTFGSASLTYTYGANRLNKITPSSGSAITFQYDHMGNVVHRGGEYFSYDDAPNLICARCTGGSNEVRYTYDGNQQRIKSVKSGNTTHEFTSNNGNHLLSFSAPVTFKMTYSYYLGNKRVAQREIGADNQWRTTYFHNDLSGSPMVATDASGNVAWKETYKPYGDKVKRQSASAGNLIGFHGKLHDDHTGLSYMGARYYDPLAGRFMGMDPKDFDPDNIHSFNRYAYANNNPHKYVDPDGHSPLDVAFLVYDIGKLGVALYTGVGVGAAAADVAMSAVGVASPIPGTGQAIKAARAADKAVDVAKTVDNAADVAKSNKTYQTYTKTHPETGKVYFGRTSGTGTPLENIAKRDANHAKNQEGYGPAVLDRSSSNRGAIRGREQMGIEANGGARSQGGKSGNAINGISDKNPDREKFICAATKEFGDC